VSEVICKRCGNSARNPENPAWPYAYDLDNSFLCAKCWDDRRYEYAQESAKQRVGDPVNSPGHYTRLEPQPIDVIEKWNLPFHESQVVKYIARAGHKDPTKHLEDLKKAEFYLKRKITQLESK
jgi:hypothetical protein